MEKNLRLKANEQKEKEEQEKKDVTYVSGYTNYDDHSPIKSLTDNPLYAKNIYVGNNKKKKN